MTEPTFDEKFKHITPGMRRFIRLIQKYRAVQVCNKQDISSKDCPKHRDVPDNYIWFIQDGVGIVMSPACEISPKHWGRETKGTIQL